jgi:hypothetical protein
LVFATTNFVGHNPSYACRGIWKARQILMNGCRRVLGWN